MEIIRTNRRRPVSDRAFRAADMELATLAALAASSGTEEPRRESMGAAELLGAYELLGDEQIGGIFDQFRPPGYPAGPFPTPLRPGWTSPLIQKEPTRQRNYVMGFDSTTTVAAAATVDVTSRPQVIFRPDRLVVPAAIADNFLIADIRIGKNSQFASSGNVPAATFVAGGFDVKLKLDTAQVAMDIVLRVTNISGGGVRFLASLIGPAVE